MLLYEVVYLHAAGGQTQRGEFRNPWEDRNQH